MRFSACALLTLQAAGLAVATPVSQLVDAPEANAKSVFEKRAPRHLRPILERRADTQGAPGQPIWGNRGDKILGGTNKQLDLDNPDNLGRQSTDAGTVPNLKWSFSDSKARVIPGGWTRTSVITDLPSSKDIAGAQQHLKAGAYRELHWHKVAEWGYVYAGEIIVTATDENGRNQATKLGVGDYWYFPKGEAHGVQAITDAEYLLIFDDGNFEATGVTFNLPDWLIRTPKDIIAKNFGVNESVFDNIPKADPYMVPGKVRQDDTNIASPYGKTDYVFFGKDAKVTQAPGGGGTIQIVDSSNFPVAKTIASSLVTIKPGALRELHWHPNAEEWLYFLKGNAQATVYIGNSNSRTFDFQAGDTAVFPDNSGHYIENRSKNETVVFLEIYKADRVKDVSLAQWLALTPPNHVAEILNISLSVVQNIKKEKQIIVGGVGK